MASPMTRKQQRLAEKPVNLLTFAPDKAEKAGVNPFAPSPLRAAVGKVFVKLEDLTERFEDWCQHERPAEGTVQPLGQRLSQWLKAPVARHAEEAAQEEQGLIPVRRWEGSVGEVIFRLRDRAGYVQRILTAQARELKEWVLQQTQSTKAEVEHLREQVVSQQAHVEDLTAQLQDLRALVTSQQQVLMYLGKDMDVAQPPAVELSLVPPRVPPYREKKSPRDRRDTAVEAPYLNA